LILACVTSQFKVQGVIEELLSSIGRDTLDSHSEQNRRLVPAHGCRYLHVRFARGSAFLDHAFLSLDEKERGTISISAFLFGQRFSSKPIAASVEPEINDAFLFEIPQHIDQASLCKVVHMQFSNPSPCSSGWQVNETLNIVAVHHGSDDSTELIGTQQIEWRRVLLTGYLSLTAELAPHADGSVSAGVLPIQVRRRRRRAAAPHRCGAPPPHH
jgi:hypothetical protein